MLQLEYHLVSSTLHSAGTSTDVQVTYAMFNFSVQDSVMRETKGR